MAASTPLISVFGDVLKYFQPMELCLLRVSHQIQHFCACKRGYFTAIENVKAYFSEYGEPDFLRKLVVVKSDRLKQPLIVTTPGCVDSVSD